MSKVKYRVREFTPKANQGGTHSFFAEAVISTDIDATELAKKIAARTGIKSYEASMAIHAIADIVAEETLDIRDVRGASPVEPARRDCKHHGAK